MSNQLANQRGMPNMAFERDAPKAARCFLLFKHARVLARIERLTLGILVMLSP